MDEDLRKAEREGDEERARRLRERAGLAPFKVWVSDAEGATWLEEAGETFLALAEAEDVVFAEDARLVVRDEGYLVVWSEDRGYVAAARYATDAPEPLELLLVDEDRFCEGELDLRPTLCGGPPEFEADPDPYDEIHE